MQERTLRSTTTTTDTNVSSTTYVNGEKVTTLTPTTTRTVTVPANMAYMYEWLDPTTQNVSISWRNGQAGSPAIRAALPGDLLLCMNGSYPASQGPNVNMPYNYFAVNLNKSVGAVGSVLW